MSGKIMEGVSGKMVRIFLESIDYPKERIHDICYAIAIHVDLKADFDGEYNAFTLSVQEADNIDRVGAYRLYETLEAVQFSKQPIDVQIQYVESMLQTLNEYASYTCTTKTAQTLWLDRIQFQMNYFERLKDQLKYPQPYKLWINVSTRYMICFRFSISV